MGRIRRDITVMTPTQAQAFAKLVNSVAADVGVVKCMELLGLSTPTYYRLVRDNYITDKQAATLMAGYRKYKAGRALAA